MFWVYAALSLALAYLAWSVICFAQNYVAAKKIGLPIVISPVNPMSPVWLLTKHWIIPIASALPFGWGEWAARAEMGWTYGPKFSVHARHGEAFCIVNPTYIEVLLAEPAATDDLLRRRNDFIKDPAVYGMLEFYGPNLDSVNGKVWDRHRKVTVPPFNEHNSALVWRETANQADQLFADWSKQPGVTSTQRDVHAVALNVLCGAGFGLQSSFIDTKSAGSPGGGEARLGYRESLRILLSNTLQLILLGPLAKLGVPTWMFWGSMRTTAAAFAEFKGYMSEMLAKEKSAFEQGDLSRHNLMSALVRASEESRKAAETSKESSVGSTAAGLSDDEVYGNLFIFNLAGHDTTAATLHFALTLLAVYPEWQEWIGEEVDRVRKADPTGLWYYEETFPQLQRCLALMVRL
jgi:cytochrome P450